MRITIIYILSLVVLFSCEKKYNPALPYYYNYFPLESEAWIQYDVVDINHEVIGSDTLNYQLLEVVKEEFLDDQGRLSYRIERFWRNDSLSNWKIKDVWVANLTQTTAEKVEENERYTKLVFPVKDTKYWNGNALNSKNEWQYNYDSLHIEKTLNNLTFDSTITVLQRNNINVVQHEEAFEIYAIDIGMIYKKFIDYDYVFNDKVGVELEMIVTAYGK